MYEVEIALLSGDVAGRFGESFVDDVERLADFFKKADIDRRAYTLGVWDVLKSDAKARKADPREPLERLYDEVMAAQLFGGLTEEQINQRLVAWLAG